MNTEFHYEGQNQSGSIDYVIRFEQGVGGYIVDIFDSGIEDADEAYIESLENADFNEAVSDMKDYRLI